MVQLKGKHIEKKLTLWNKLWEINTLSKFIQDYSRIIQTRASKKSDSHKNESILEAIS